MTPSRARIQIPREQIADFCRRYRIRWLALFGSVLRDDFRPDSDVDVLIEFESDQRYTYYSVPSIGDTWRMKE
jgi:predicted nucleotidyltransferase